MALKSRLQLMTYPDSLGGNLENLQYILNQYLKKAVSGLHILPFYPSTADRGFCPTTHLEIDPNFGTWEDITELSKDYEVVADLICGHISDKSGYFLDYLARENDSQYADIFLPLKKIYTQGYLTIDQMKQVCYLTPIPPFINIEFNSGKKEMHWKTFMPHQIELDVNSPKTRELFLKWIQNHAKMGIKMLRLDALETVCKDEKLGFKLIPKTFEFVNWVINEAKKLNLEILCEVFTDYQTNLEFIKMGAYVYDFYLPDKIFYSIFSKDATVLKDWYKISPKQQIAPLTNHDGIALGCAAGSLNPSQIEFTKNKIFENAGESTILASGIGSNNISVDRINATLLETVFRNQDEWLIAHVLHLFAPGIPQIYYNDLLAQRNDEELFHETGEGRSLIRHNHRMRQIDHKFKQPFVQKLIKIMELRNNYPAFDGNLEVVDTRKEKIELNWKNNEYQVNLYIDLDTGDIKIKYFEPKIKAFEILNL